MKKEGRKEGREEVRKEGRKNLSFSWVQANYYGY